MAPTRIRSSACTAAISPPCQARRLPPSELPSNLAQQLIAQAGNNEALYRINVQLDEQDIKAYGETLPLKAGLTLDADVLQERRKVWEWVLEPVLAARQ